MKSNTGTGRLRRIAHLRAAKGRGKRRGGSRRSVGGANRLQLLTLLIAGMPGLAALAALLFTWQDVRIAEQGHITSRFNDAISNLGSTSLDVRFGGIYALERLMQDSARDQPRTISVLSAYVRQHARVPKSGFAKEDESLEEQDKIEPATDITAVMNVLADRTPDRDGRAQLDWTRADLRGLQLSAWTFKEAAKIERSGDVPDTRVPFSWAALGGADLRHAALGGVDLHNAILVDANLHDTFLQHSDLSHAVLEGANLNFAHLAETDLTGADLNWANLREVDASSGGNNFTNATLVGADMTRAGLDGANLTNAKLVEANLTGAQLIGANLHGAKLSTADKALKDEFGPFEKDANANLADADLEGADLTNADLRGVDFSRANLMYADLTGAKLTGVKLTGAKLHGVRGLPPSLR
ncbi:pentapeptide repeat-containing protein [Streptomyces swartbergensis]|uniref:pentapeptide repeat-containing protein n=1 Tax=Streptomyces swartbergensis TaxID=487165 RepID=UPI003827BFD9